MCVCVYMCSYMCVYMYVCICHVCLYLRYICEYMCDIFANKFANIFANIFATIFANSLKFGTFLLLKPTLLKEEVSGARKAKQKHIDYQDEKTRQTDKFLFDIHFMIFGDC